MGLPVVRTGNTALDRFLEQVREYIESSRGGAGTAAQNRVLRVSDLSSIVQLAAAGAAKLPKSYTQQEMEKFAADLSNTRLFQSLTGPDSALGGAVDGLPRTNITEVKSQKGATASGVAVNAIVATEDTRSVAALVTTVEARLDNFDGVASIEEAYLALADATTGLEAQYTVKVTAGGAVAGFGLAATDPVGGTPSSAFLVSADKFAVVAPGYSGGLTNAPASWTVPFYVDVPNSKIGFNSNVEINGNLLVSGTITSDKIGTNTLSAVNIDTTGRIRSTGSYTSLGAVGGLKASVEGYNSEAGQIGTLGYGTYGVYGFNQHTDNITGAAIRGLTQGNTGVALWIGGKFKWQGSAGTFTYQAPDGTGDKFMCANGTWSTIGTAADANALGGYAPSNWVRYVATDPTPRTFVGYMLFSANGASAYIPLYT